MESCARAAVKALIIDGRRFLVVQDAIDGYWELPGGKIRGDETPAHALAREVREELGLAIAVGDPVGFCWTAHTGRWVVMTVIRCKATSRRIDTTKNPADEHIGQARWVTREEFLSCRFPVEHKNLKALIRRGW